MFVCLFLVILNLFVSVAIFFFIFLSAKGSGNNSTQVPLSLLLKSDDAIVSSHLDWCRQRILSVKPEDPATAGIPAQEVCDYCVISSICVIVCVCVLQYLLALCSFVRGMDLVFRSILFTYFLPPTFIAFNPVFFMHFTSS